jgi:acetylglutamate kinase
MRARVVKVGGRPLSDPVWLSEFASLAALARAPLVVVHGGGPEIDTLSTRLGVEVQRHEGLRATSPAGLEVTTMVLSGLLNKRLVSAFQGAGVDALGVSGIDGSLVVASVAGGGRLGRVGEVSGVRTELLRALLALGLVPVLSPVSRGIAGGALNVNADDVAVAVAAALDAEALLFLTDVPGVRGRNGGLASLCRSEAEVLLDAGVIRDGMAVKVRAALRGVAAGAGSVRIGGAGMLVAADSGTAILAEAEALV